MKTTDIEEVNRIKKFMETLSSEHQYNGRVMVRITVQNDPKVKARKDEIRAEYGGATHDIEHDDIVFGVCRLFDTRLEMLAFVEEHGLTLPSECVKSGSVSDGKPVTRVIYVFNHKSLAFNISYTRDGLPTKHCKIVLNTYYDVACDIDGSDNNTEDDDVLF